MIRLTIRTTERVRVVSPYDAAVTAALRAQLLARDLSGLTNLKLGDATWFELRGLSDGEIRQLRPLMPAMPVEAAAWLRSLGEVEPGDTRPEPTDAQARQFLGYQTELGLVFLRACLEQVTNLPEWPTQREPFLGLELWPAAAVDSLGPTATWLAELALSLNTLSAEKKTVSGSPPAGASGTTAAEVETAASANG